MMIFKEAFNMMVFDGAKIKRRSWAGYWEWTNGTIMMHTKEGRVIDIKCTNDVSYTIRNMLEDDWEEANGFNCPVYAKEIDREIAETKHIATNSSSTANNISTNTFRSDIKTY